MSKAQSRTRRLEGCEGVLRQAEEHYRGVLRLEFPVGQRVKVKGLKNCPKVLYVKGHMVTLIGRGAVMVAPKWTGDRWPASIPWRDVTLV